MNPWIDVYPELVNKIRWSIQTALSSELTRFPYPASQALATVLSQDVINVVKCSTESPGVLDTTGSIRGFLQQVGIDKALARE